MSHYSVIDYTAAGRQAYLQGNPDLRDSHQDHSLRSLRVTGTDLWTYVQNRPSAKDVLSARWEVIDGTAELLRLSRSA